MNDNEKIMYSKLFTVLIADEKLKTKYLALIKSILTKVGKKYVQNILDIYPDFFECLKEKYPGNKSWVVTPLFDWTAPVNQDIIQKEWRASIFGNIFSAPSILLTNHDIMVQDPCVSSDKEVLFNSSNDFITGEKVGDNGLSNPLYSDNTRVVFIRYMAPDTTENASSNADNFTSVKHCIHVNIELAVFTQIKRGKTDEKKYTPQEFADYCRQIPTHPLALTADALGFVFTGKES